MPVWAWFSFTMMATNHQDRGAERISPISSTKLSVESSVSKMINHLKMEILANKGCILNS